MESHFSYIATINQELCSINRTKIKGDVTKPMKQQGEIHLFLLEDVLKTGRKIYKPGKSSQNREPPGNAETVDRSDFCRAKPLTLPNESMLVTPLAKLQKSVDSTLVLLTGMPINLREYQGQTHEKI